MKRGTLLGRKPETEIPAEPAAAASPAPAPAARTRSREGKRNVTAFIDPAAFKQLKRIAVEEDLAMQDLFVEGLNAVFEKRGLARIA